MLRKQWQEYALKARQIAKRIVSGDEVNKDGVRLIVVTDKLDIYATEALNRKFSRNGSKASVHTYAGGVQEIATQHTDGSNGLFRSNGECQSTNNPIDIEVKEYMNNLEENKQYNNMKKLIRLTESDLHRIVKESVNKVLKEGWKDGMEGHTWRNDDGTEQTAEGDFYEYAEKYGLAAFGYAIYNMIKEGDMKVNFDMANALWMYGGVEEL